MKRIILAVSVLFFMSVSVQAQKLHAGAKLGANLSKIDGQSFKEGYKLGYQLGAWASLDFGAIANVGIQPEILYSQSNSRLSTSIEDIYGNIQVTGDSAIKLNYLTIPVLLRIKVSKLLTLNAGPQFGILMDKNQNLEENGKAAFKSGDLSGVLGAQVNLGSLFAYGRYSIGLSDNNNLGATDAGSSDKWKNQQIQLGIGLKLF